MNVSQDRRSESCSRCPMIPACWSDHDLYTFAPHFAKCIYLGTSLLSVPSYSLPLCLIDHALIWTHDPSVIQANSLFPIFVHCIMSADPAHIAACLCVSSCGKKFISYNKKKYRSMRCSCLDRWFSALRLSNPPTVIFELTTTALDRCLRLKCHIYSCIGTSSTLLRPSVSFATITHGTCMHDASRFPKLRSSLYEYRDVTVYG